MVVKRKMLRVRINKQSFSAIAAREKKDIRYHGVIAWCLCSKRYGASRSSLLSVT